MFNYSWLDLGDKSESVWFLRPSPERIIADILIIGEPASKARARTIHRGDYTRTFTPKETVEAQKNVTNHLDEVFLEPDGERAWGVAIRFCSGHYARKDVDNLIKLVLDASTGTVWIDDSQVVEITSSIFRDSLAPRTQIVYYTVPGRLVRRSRRCEVCSRSFHPTSQKINTCSQKCASVLRGSEWRERTWNCVICNKEFQGNAPFHKYCSIECKRVAHNRRHEGRSKRRTIEKKKLEAIAIMVLKNS
jgi:Holliday junction resolvase RusA-like endonuclease